VKPNVALAPLILGLFVLGFGVLILGYAFIVGAIYAGSAVLPFVAVGVVVVVVGALVMRSAFRF
jgi:hypothetical protein